jgi:hypothetical protein
MCDRLVDTYVGNNITIKTKCGYVFMNHMGHLEIAECTFCRKERLKVESMKKGKKVGVVENADGSASFRGVLVGMGF